MYKKSIHYCWFGGNPKSDLIKKCQESWKRYCPDYEIIEWNESNFDINCCDYVKEAYAAKKWAFVSDYCRFYVLYHHGGIYLDTDVELIKPLDDLPDTFVGFENQSTCNSGLIRGADKGDEICRRMLESYNCDRFLLEDGRYNTKTVCIRETELLKEYGLVLNNKMQQIAGIRIYPSEYFSPKDYLTEELKITENTISIHHYDASWYTDEDKLAAQLRAKYRKLMPAKLALRVGKFAAVAKMRGLKSAAKETLYFLQKS